MVDVAEFEIRLKKRLEDLSKRVRGIEEDLREPVSPDFEEAATEMEGDEVLQDLEQASVKEIAQIRSALRRIEDGSFGECTNCGTKIDERRLEAVPHTPLCIDCASGKIR